MAKGRPPAGSRDLAGKPGHNLGSVGDVSDYEKRRARRAVRILARDPEDEAELLSALGIAIQHEGSM